VPPIPESQLRGLDFCTFRTACVGEDATRLIA
jgi:hypothetical protein